MGPLVRLAGYNIDSDLIQEVLNLLEAIEREAGRLPSDQAHAFLRSAADQIRSNLSADSFTPETISAAYARISRDPKNVTELRRAARLSVARARKSNESIIFGLGHASVAEHATFNFDVSGISRLASEELQSHRLASFTEKSQRYVTVGEDYTVPPEIEGTDWETQFSAVVPALFAAYDSITAELTQGYMPKDGTTLSKQEIRDLENRAKEDARYLLPLACRTQMGMTMNARNVEHVVLELSDHPLAEIRQLGAAISCAVANHAPSLVKYTVRKDYPRSNRQALRQVFGGYNWLAAGVTAADGPSVRLVDATENAEETILRALAFTSGGLPYTRSMPEPQTLNADRIWRMALEGMGSHDPVLREFEIATMTFEVEISASCFAQLKRHRMMTLLSQEYGSADGVIVPPSIADAGLRELFIAAAEKAQNAANRLHSEHPALAPYLLTNAHKKRVLMHANVRELYHFARLRCDEHAQWEIRSLGQQVMKIAAETWPRVFMLGCGKDRFEETYRRVFPDGQPI